MMSPVAQALQQLQWGKSVYLLSPYGTMTEYRLGEGGNLYARANATQPFYEADYRDFIDKVERNRYRVRFDTEVVVDRPTHT